MGLDTSKGTSEPGRVNGPNGVHSLIGVNGHSPAPAPAKARHIVKTTGLLSKFIGAHRELENYK